MLLHKALFIAVGLTAVAWTPAQLYAQDRGLDRAATASARGQANASQNSGKMASGKANSELPAGIAKRFEGETLPPGIRRTRGESDPVVPEPDPDPDPEPDPDPDGCTIIELEGLPPVEVCGDTP